MQLGRWNLIFIKGPLGTLHVFFKFPVAIIVCIKLVT